MGVNLLTPSQNKESLRVLVLGANGFIGSHLVEALLGCNHIRVVAVDKETHNSFNLRRHPCCEFVETDVLHSAKLIHEIIMDTDVVIPLIATPRPEHFLRDPISTFDLTFAHNLDIIRACAATSTRIVFPSSSEVYGLCSQQPLSATKSPFVTGPAQDLRWIYSSSKQLLERFLFGVGRTNNLPFTIFRPFNWFGPRLDNSPLGIDRPARAVTSFIRMALAGKNLAVVGDGKQARSFTYVSDGISAILQIIKDNGNSTNHRVFNVGNPKNLVSISDLARLVIDLVDPSNKRRLEIEHIDGQALYGEGYTDIKQRIPDITDLKNTLGWTPQVCLEDGLRLTITSMIEPEPGVFT